MIRGLALLISLFLGAGAAVAGLSRSELADVSVTLPADAHIDLDISAHDSSGRSLTVRQILDGHPGLVTFADFTCTSLCGSDLRLLSGALEGSGVPASEYRLIVIGIDPKDTSASADAMAAAELSTPIRKNAVLLLPNAPTVQRLTAALGFRYVYDATIDQYAHPAVVYAVASNGAVTAALSPFALDVSALRSALLAPAPGQRSLVDQIRILCYALDPTAGVNTRRVMILLKVGAAATVVVVAAGLLLLARKAAS